MWLLSMGKKKKSSSPKSLATFKVLQCPGAPFNYKEIGFAEELGSGVRNILKYSKTYFGTNPKFEDDTVGEHLAFIGSINDEILQKTELACDLISFMVERYPGVLGERYQIDEGEVASAILEGIARNRGCLLKGNELDFEKAAIILLDEFRNGKLGRISLEEPSL